MLRKVGGLTLLLLVFSQILLAQPQIEWQRCYGGSQFDWINSLRPTSDGGYVAIGFSRSSNGDLTSNQGDYDVWVVKLTNMGAISWQRSYGGTDEDRGSSIEQTSDGGYIVCSRSQSNDGDVTGYHGGGDCWIMKLSATGNIVWQKSLGGSDLEYPTSVRQTNDGGYIFVGTTLSNDGDVSGNHGLSDAWVVKLDSNGAISWQQCIGGTMHESAYAIRDAHGGGYVFVGSTSTASTDSEVKVVKITDSGTVVWEQVYGGNSRDFALSVEQTTDGGYIVGAVASGTGDDIELAYGKEDIWILKLDSLGAISWQRVLGGSENDWVYAAEETSDGGYIIGGRTNSTNWNVTGNPYGGDDTWILKLSDSGQIQWKDNYGGSGDDNAQTCLQTPDGGYIVAGGSSSNNIDVSGNHGSFDGWIYKLSSTVGVDMADEVSSIEVFPNPATDYLKLRTNSELTGSAFSVYNALGKVLVSGTIGEGETIIEMENLASGVHFVHLPMSGKTITFVKQ